ncbi:MAG: hypothetical protein OQK12_18425, partial [Motiliproteus sp.]|nr:hypothetical protein [Motiliproteus sp.]
TLYQLKQQIAEQRPLEQVAQLDHLCDLWTGLFFGIGVIWTAIGMRSALIYALGDPEATASAGAFNLLRNLVEGGILIALSTTIFGGIGGYLMRVVKTVAVGNQLRSYYNHHALQADTAVLEQLQAIEKRLQSLGTPPPSQLLGEHHESKSMVSD